MFVHIITMKHFFDENASKPFHLNFPLL